MTTTCPNRMTQPLMLQAWTASELMTTNPQSLRRDATVAEAARFLSTRGFSAAPVIDEAGRPVGVLSRTDLLRHHGQQAVRPQPAPLGCRECGSALDTVTSVRDVMTPAVFYVHADTPAAKVVDEMLALDVRRLFVVDHEGVLIGVVSAFDVLRGLDLPFLAAG